MYLKFIILMCSLILTQELQSNWWTQHFSLNLPERLNVTLVQIEKKNSMLALRKVLFLLFFYMECINLTVYDL